MWQAEENMVSAGLMAAQFAMLTRPQRVYYLDFVNVGPVQISRPVGALPSGASNFRVGRRGAAWWEYTTGAGEHRACSSQGLSIIRGAQEFLMTHPPARAGAAVDGNVWGSTHMANHRTLTADGNFGPASCKSLWKYLNDAGVEASLLADMRADFDANNTTSMGLDTSRPGAALRTGTLRALIWAAAHADGDIRRIAIPSGTVTPLWGVAPASDGAAAGIKTCWNPATENVPNDAGGSGSGSNGASTREVPLTTNPDVTPPPAARSGWSTATKWWVGFGVVAVGSVGAGVAIDTYRKKHKK